MFSVHSAVPPEADRGLPGSPDAHAVDWSSQAALWFRAQGLLPTDRAHRTFFPVLTRHTPVPDDAPPACGYAEAPCHPAFAARHGLSWTMHTVGQVHLRIGGLSTLIGPGIFDALRAARRASDRSSSAHSRSPRCIERPVHSE